MRTGGCVKLKTVAEIRRSSACDTPVDLISSRALTEMGDSFWSSSEEHHFCPFTIQLRLILCRAVFFFNVFFLEECGCFLVRCGFKNLRVIGIEVVIEVAESHRQRSGD